MTQKTSLMMWTVYDHPTDFPDHFVAREFVIGSGAGYPTDSFIQATTLEPIRETLRDMGLVCLPRYDEDEPHIVETWL